MTRETRDAVRNALRAARAPALEDEPAEKRRSILRLLSVVLETIKPQLPRLSFDIEKPVDRISISLYLTIIQLSDAMLLVASAGPSIAVPTLGRQALDAYVDLHNVLTHNDYWKRLELADDQSWLKGLQHASAGKNPYWTALSTSGSFLAEGRKEHADRIKQWTREGLKVAEAKERFELAGMEREYDALWLMLSSFAHNNSSLLISRHFRIREGERPEAEATPSQVPFEMACIGHSAELLILASEKIHARYGDRSLDLSAARKASEELNQRMLAE
jgi:hypothetical protein